MTVTCALNGYACPDLNDSEKTENGPDSPHFSPREADRKSWTGDQLGCVTKVRKKTEAKWRVPK